MAVQPGSPNPNAKRVALEHKLCFVSLLDRRQVEGVELIRNLLEAQKYLAELKKRIYVEYVSPIE